MEHQGHACPQRWSCVIHIIMEAVGVIRSFFVELCSRICRCWAAHLGGYLLGKHDTPFQNDSKRFQAISNNFKQLQTISRPFQTISRPFQTTSNHFSLMDIPWDIPWDTPRDIPWHNPWDISHGISHVITHGISHGISHVA